MDAVKAGHDPHQPEFWRLVDAHVDTHRRTDVDRFILKRWSLITRIVDSF